MLIVLAVLSIAGSAGASLRRFVRKAPIPTRFDRSDLDTAQAGPLVIEFTSPMCYECQLAYPVLQAASAAHDVAFEVIDAKQRPDLAAKYSIRTTPTILVVDGRGRVTDGWFESPSRQDLDSALQLAGAR
ncbi:MAG: thioredoxin family protein [Actinomycetota bacterium]